MSMWEPSERYPDPAVQVLDASFNRYRLPLASIERLATGCRWSEGPVYFGDGRYVLWSDIPNDRILKWEEETGTVSVFRKSSNNANGNTRDRQGRLVTCEHRGRRVIRTEYDGAMLQRTMCKDRTVSHSRPTKPSSMWLNRAAYRRASFACSTSTATHLAPAKCSSTPAPARRTAFASISMAIYGVAGAWVKRNWTAFASSIRLPSRSGTSHCRNAAPICASADAGAIACSWPQVTACTQCT